MKICTKCKETKPLTEFYGHNNSSGLRPDCKSCCGKRRKKSYDLLKKDPEKYRLHYRKYQMIRYNMTQEGYEQMVDNQNGCCLICKIHKSNLKKVLFVDHDHKTGKVRGLLCDPCNRGLGAFKDSPENLKNALEYIKSSVR